MQFNQWSRTHPTNGDLGICSLLMLQRSTVMSLTLVLATRLEHQCGPTGHSSLMLSGDQQMEGGLPAVGDATPFDRKRGGGRGCCLMDH